MKKKFGVIDSMLGDTEENENLENPTADQKLEGELGRAISDKSETVYPAQHRGKGRPKGEEYEARSFRVKKEHFAKMRIIAAKEGLMLKDILDYALESVVTKYESKHGVIDTSQIKEQKADINELF
ncbi:MAG: hypothetical protein IIY58_02930 [Aeriscardovia sp.]|nr:hypothetical protein [Aeriscardovia sp.]